MEKFYEYIDAQLPDKHSDNVLYKFKKKTIDEMTERANELTSRGLKDKNVISDLIISEYADIVNRFKLFEKERKEKEFRRKFLIGNIIGSVTYIFMLIIIFLGISFSTQAWGKTWVIVVDGILLLVSYLLSLGIHRIVHLKRIFHVFARILLMICIMVFSVAVFIFCMAILHLPKSWIILFIGLFCMFLGDGIFASATKQKLAIFFWLAYIPSMAAMLFIITGALGILSWNTGWIMIPLSLLVNIIIIAAVVKKNTSYNDEEVMDAWKEN